jgi:SRSO17 transposase
MALEMGENVRDLQHFLGQSSWKKEPAVMIHQGLMGEALSEADGVALIDESGNVKQGQDSVGVAPQYCGSVGKVANSQVGVDLGYVSRKGYTLLDSQLFMPEEWFDDAHAELRKACGVPAELCYLTKPEIALKLLQAMVERNKTLANALVFQWVAADALYGDSITFRDGVAELKKWYFAAIKSTNVIMLLTFATAKPSWPFLVYQLPLMLRCNTIQPER